MQKTSMLLVFVILNLLFINMAVSETLDENWNKWVKRWAKSIEDNPTDQKVFEQIGKEARQWMVDARVDSNYPPNKLNTGKLIFQFYCGLFERANIKNNQDAYGRISDYWGTTSCVFG